MSKAEKVVELKIKNCRIYPEEHLPTNKGLVGLKVFKELIRLAEEKSRLQDQVLNLEIQIDCLNRWNGRR